jgi:hypothetical protein
MSRDGEPLYLVHAFYSTPAGSACQGFGLVVLAANVWSVGLAQALGISLPITPTRHPMVALRRPDDFGGRMGLHAVGLDLTRQIYLRPDIGGVTLVGSTENALTPSDPDKYAQGLTEQEIAHFRTMAAGSMPALARAVPRAGWAGMHDDTPDYHPVLDRLPGYEGLYCAAGFSGHGSPSFPSRSKRRWSASLSICATLSVNKWSIASRLGRCITVTTNPCWVCSFYSAL